MRKILLIVSLSLLVVSCAKKVEPEYSPIDTVPFSDTLDVDSSVTTLYDSVLNIDTVQQK